MSFCVALCMGFNIWMTWHPWKCIGFKGYYWKTHVNSNNTFVIAFKTCAHSSRSPRFAHLLCMGIWVLIAFGTFCIAFAHLWLLHAMGFNIWMTQPPWKCMGFKGYHLKTFVGSNDTFAIAPKTMWIAAGLPSSSSLLLSSSPPLLPCLAPFFYCCVHGF